MKTLHLDGTKPFVYFRKEKLLKFEFVVDLLIHDAVV